MSNNDLKRKLAAILSADVEGYSRLMSNDDTSTIQTLTAYKKAMAIKIRQNRGRVVDDPGDNLLAEFVSVVDAVKCAVDIQRELSERNEGLPKERKMVFRIGVTLGDIVEEKDRIYGDGVNIAARLENICDGGGVCISGTAFEHVEDKLDLDFEDLGEYDVKNIKKPVHVYRVLLYPKEATHREDPAAFDKTTKILPEKPSIAVLPFDNLSGDPGQDYLSDGVSENIITALSFVPEMFVIARNSSFTYKGRSTKVQQISEELGVRYVLEGSVINYANKVRITAQLIDAISGGHIWSERYDRDLKDLFNLLDEIAIAVTVALQVELTDGQQARMSFGSTQNFKAWSYAVKGMGIFYKFGKKDMARSRELFEKAIKIDPEYAAAVTMLAWTHKIDASFGYTDSIDNSLKLSYDLANESLSMNDKYPSVHSLFSLLYLIHGEYEKAVQAGKKAIVLGPNVAQAYLLFGEVLIYSGYFEEAVNMCEKAMRLHPHAPLYYLGHTLNAYYWVGRYDESLALAERLINMGRYEDFMLGVVWGLTSSIMVKTELGRLNEAKQDANEILKIAPWYNLKYLQTIYLYKDAANLEHWIRRLRMAGIPEDHPDNGILSFSNLSHASMWL